MFLIANFIKCKQQNYFYDSNIYWVTRHRSILLLENKLLIYKPSKNPSECTKSNYEELNRHPTLTLKDFNQNYHRWLISGENYNYFHKDARLDQLQKS